MIKGIYHSASGMIPRFFKLAAISNNLANINSTAFKADRVHFGTVLNNELSQGSVEGAPARSIEREMSYSTDFSQGSLERTGVPTQLAINGKGFFVIEGAETGEIFYTRNGNFKLNSEQELVTASGQKVLDTSDTPILIDGDDLVIAEDGQYFVDGLAIGKFQIVEFEDENVLLKRGETLYSLGNDELPEDSENSSLFQGYLENSNINTVREMVEMITLNRNYEASSRILTAQDETLKKTVQQIGRYL